MVRGEASTLHTSISYVRLAGGGGGSGYNQESFRFHVSQNW